MSLRLPDCYRDPESPIPEWPITVAVDERVIYIDLQDGDEGAIVINPVRFERIVEYVRGELERSRRINRKE
jgi:hypothetical protein